MNSINKKKVATDSFTEFVSAREAGAEKIVNNAKAKGGFAMLTWHHFKVKLPYYKKAAADKFDLAEAKKEFDRTYNKISTSMTQIEFQTEMGRLEVLGELIIKEESKPKGTNESQVLSYTQFLNEKKNEREHPRQYKAPEGSSRDRKLDRATALLKAGKKEEAYRLRDEMEEQVRKNPNWKNTPRPDSKVDEAKSSKSRSLSKETLAKIRKVATKKGYSFADLKREYIKGLGAFYSSGSRPGMTAHQWAMARVNAASPSKSWANVKKTK
jgi:hypothetical protein